MTQSSKKHPSPKKPKNRSTLDKKPLFITIALALLTGIFLINPFAKKHTTPDNPKSTSSVESSETTETTPAIDSKELEKIKEAEKQKEKEQQAKQETDKKEKEALRQNINPGQYNYLKSGNPPVSYDNPSSPEYQADQAANKQVVNDLVQATFDYLGSPRNWHPQPKPKEGSPTKVTWDDEPFPFFIQDGELVNRFVSQLNESVEPELARNNTLSYGQPGQPKPLQLPTLGDKYHISFLNIEDITKPGESQQTFKVLLCYQIDNYRNEEYDYPTI